MSRVLFTYRSHDSFYYYFSVSARARVKEEEVFLCRLKRRKIRVHADEEKRGLEFRVCNPKLKASAISNAK
jgi:hypothetical protein